jgi:hypothetical protein
VLFRDRFDFKIHKPSTNKTYLLSCFCVTATHNHHGFHGLRKRERHSLRRYANLLLIIRSIVNIYLWTCLKLTFSPRVDEAPRYERDRSASPRPTRRNESPRGGPRRSASPDRGGRDDRLVSQHLRSAKL